MPGPDETKDLTKPLLTSVTVSATYSDEFPPLPGQKFSGRKINSLISRTYAVPHGVSNEQAAAFERALFLQLSKECQSNTEIFKAGADTALVMIRDDIKHGVMTLNVPEGMMY